MKVIIGKYKNWIGPYQIADSLQWLGWSEDKCHLIGEWLASTKDGKDSKLLRFCNWVEGKKQRKVKIKIHNYDIWSMDSTLSYIILPMLKMVQKDKHGSPFVDDADVPEEIRSTSCKAKEYEYDTDENYHKRWDYIIEELIWTFEQLHPDNDWEDQYYSGTLKLNTSNDGPVFETSDDYKIDEEGRSAHAKRIQRGCELFGKYFQSLCT